MSNFAMFRLIYQCDHDYLAYKGHVMGQVHFSNHIGKEVVLKMIRIVFSFSKTSCKSSNNLDKMHNSVLI